MTFAGVNCLDMGPEFVLPIKLSRAVWAFERARTDVNAFHVSQKTGRTFESLGVGAAYPATLVNAIDFVATIASVQIQSMAKDITGSCLVNAHLGFISWLSRSVWLAGQT